MEERACPRPWRMARALALVVLAAMLHSADADNHEEVASLDTAPTISVRLGKDEIRGLLMGGAGNEMRMTPAGFPAAALQRTTQAAVYRAEKDVKQQEAKEGGELFKVNDGQLGEMAPAKKGAATKTTTKL